MAGEENPVTEKRCRFHFLPHKIGFYAIFASRGVMATFFPLHLKQLGLNAAQIGAVMFFRPVGGLIGASVAPEAVLKLRGDTQTMLIFYWFCLVTFFGIGWISPSAAEVCPQPENVTSVNVSGMPPPDEPFPGEKPPYLMYRMWMYRDDDVLMTMVLCCLLICAADVFSVGASSVHHGVTMKALGRENYRQFGIIRSWGSFGHATGALFTGLIVYVTITEEKICRFLTNFPDYHFICYTFGVLCVLAIGNASYVHQGDVEAEDNDGDKVMPYREFAKVFLNFKVFSLIIVLLCRSVFYAVTQGFVNWHLENIGASPAFLGFANFITHTTEFLAFLAVPWLIQVFGHTKLVGVVIFSYVCRFLIYSAISNPLYILPVEVMEGVMYACLCGSSVAYLSDKVPSEGQTQLQGLLQGIEMIGIGVGFPVSGLLTQSFGAPTMFVIFAVSALAASVFYVISQVIPSKSKPDEQL